MPTFPNVPNVPGVPPLLRAPGISAAALILLTSDLIAGSFTILGQPRWGIFRGGVPVIVADNVVSFDFKRDWSIADYPIEEGGFETYDKVQLPYDVRIRFSTGGSESDRQAFLNSIAAVADTIDLYDVVTPEAIYQSVNISHYDFHRTSTNGVGLIVVDIWMTEVRITATAAFANTQQPNVAGGQNQGAVQPLTPAATIQDRFSNFQ